MSQQRLDSKKRQNKNMLPRTYEEFMASRKKQPNVSTMTAPQRKPKVTARKENNFVEKTFASQMNQTVRPIEYEDVEELTPTVPLEIEERVIYSDYSKIRQELGDSKFDSIKLKIEESLKKTNLEGIIQPLDINRFTRQLEILSLDSLTTLEREFAKPKHQRDQPVIDQILNQNKFFLIFSRDKRYKIYEAGELIILPKDTEVYRQGTSGDEMFVIVKGSVHILQTKETSYGEKMVVQFTSLYEGAHFGETSMGFDDANAVNSNEDALPVPGAIVVVPKEERQNTIKTSTQTYLLKIHHNFYKELITNSIEDDFEKKMLLVASIDILKGQTKLFITPLVSGLSRVKYKYGEVIIRKGEPVNKFYILAEGEVQVLLEERSRRKVSAVGLQNREKNFVYKTYSKEKRVQTANAFAKTFYYPKEEYQKSLLYGNKKLVGDEIEFTDHLVFKELKPVAFFGGRAFLTEFFRHEKQRIFPEEEFVVEARLNVVCNSLKAVLYELDQKKFNSLPDSLQNVILEGLSKTLEFDSADIGEKLHQRKKWKDYSSKLVESILKEKKSRRLG